MLFHTWIFLVFFVLFYAVYLISRKTWFREPWLLISSYIFYAWWNPLYLLLIVWSTLIDYTAVTFMERSGRRKLWLSLSIINNLFLLSLFKYGPFISDNINLLLIRFGIPFSIPAPGLLLPVGISFYTFQSMSYTIDFYRGKIEREKSLIRFATFVSFFPQLVAGPIERARNLLPQLRDKASISSKDVSAGLSLFVVGLFKKVALADYLALYVDRIYGAPSSHQGLVLLLATFAFAWQIYFDFSGYTDMARGIGRMLGIRLMLNFNNPYLADGLGDFWKRWHISLSTWFRDYVYIPLGGNRKSKLKTYRNIVIAMLISGLWHGAAWMFVIWGALHAFGYIATRELERSDFYLKRIPRIVKQVTVFSYVTFAWIFFRAANLDDAFIIISRIFRTVWSDPQFPLLVLLLILSIGLCQFLSESRLRIFLQSPSVKIVMIIWMILNLIMFDSPGAQPFIYFQF